MKKMRKGFTLVELLIVIGIIGILGAMGMISGQGAVSAAKATTIIEGLQNASGAMMLYYEGNMNTIDLKGVEEGTIEVEEDDGNGGTTTTTQTVTSAAKIAAGANIYLKGGTQLVAESTAGSYSVSVFGTGAAQEWWVVYTFVTNSAGDTKVKEVLASKEASLGLKGAATLGTAAPTDDFAISHTFVALKVR